MITIKVKHLNESEKAYLIESVKNDKERFFTDLPTNSSYTIRDNGIIIPAFINIENDVATLLWINKDFRRKGYGSFLINSFNIKYVQAHHSSISFWKALNFNMVNSKGLICMKKN